MCPNLKVRWIGAWYNNTVVADKITKIVTDAAFLMLIKNEDTHDIQLQTQDSSNKSRFFLIWRDSVFTTVTLSTRSALANYKKG